jgi:hypothetical protein
MGANSILLLEQPICLQRLFAGLLTNKAGLGIKISDKRMFCPLQVIFRLMEPVEISRHFSTILISDNQPASKPRCKHPPVLSAVIPAKAEIQCFQTVEDSWARLSPG